MRLSNRSFPHPVVGNADDVPGAEFQATLGFESDRTNFYLTASIRCSSKTLLGMVRKGTACYSLHVECSNTLFRKTIDFTEAEDQRFAIAGTLIHDAVEVNAFIRATADVPRYKVDGAHDDYGDATFVIRKGDILAVGDGQTFDAEHPVDQMRRIGSIIEVDEMKQDGDHPMKVDTGDNDKIRIVLCKADFAAYREIKAVPHLTGHLTTTLVLPVLVQAIHLLADPDDPPQTKWAKVLQRRLDELGDLPATADALEKAQRVLRLPIRRALSEAKTFLAGSVP